ncbi:MAG: MFS transporter [Ornithinimicrobium sp.]|uniref:MFS transporter n=1 Tax=Ornithinimicrobium sp. TaxID=1977084 RepID=UPI0026DF02CA|nr:MFS transporter [Ornithinimicrobium sp.]MDO5740050.1 MFS transporter [Ornithinimicrobium sp.]
MTILSPAPVCLRHARAGAAAAFAAQGLCFISLTTRLPRLQDRWDLSEVATSGFLLMVVLLAGAGSVGAEWIARHRHSDWTLRLGLVLLGLGLGGVALAPDLWVFVATLAVYAVGLGLVDASTNMQAVAVEHRYGRPILPSFHGAWTAGGIAATLIAIAVAHLSLAQSLLPVVIVPVLVALFAPLLPAVTANGTGTETTGGTTRAADDPAALPWRRITVLGIAMVLFYMVDSAATTWGPIYLDSTFAAPERFLPLATLPYLVATLSARLAGDRMVARFGAVPQLRLGGIVAAGALAVIVFAPSWPVAVLGFTVLGAAVAVIAPLSFSAAATLAGEAVDPIIRQARVDAVIARFNQFNYVGALLGAVMTGLVGAGSLRVGFAVPMILILAIIPLAKAFRTP